MIQKKIKYNTCDSSCGRKIHYTATVKSMWNTDIAISILTTCVKVFLVVKLSISRQFDQEWTGRLIEPPPELSTVKSLFIYLIFNYI